MKPVLHLVSCVSVKLDRRAPACDLYCSPWFKFARRVVEREPWAILSARHGLVWPHDMISPYDQTLADMTANERRQWAARVLSAIPPAHRYVLWAGRLYTQHLSADLRAELPLRGLGIGQQLAFMKAAAALH